MLDKNTVQDLRDKVYENNNDSAYGGMTYEQGVADALDVVLEEMDLEEFEADLPPCDDDEEEE